MRMFLVGMCDVFLLLYLTALAEIDSRPVSRLTVRDYAALQQSRDDLERRREESESVLISKAEQLRKAEERIAQLEKQAKRLAEEAAAAGRLRETQKKESAKSADIQQKLSAEKAEIERKLAEARRLSEEERRRQEEQQRMLAEIRARAMKQEQSLEEARREADEKQRVLEEAKRLAEEQKRLAEEARVRAEASAKEAEIARLAAEESAKEAEQAKKGQAEAKLTAKLAGMRESAAMERRRAAEEQADQARHAAEEANRESRAAQDKVKEVIQPAQKAYVDNVRSRTVSLSIHLGVKGMLGTSEQSIALFGVPVRVNKERLVFVPLEQTGLGDIDSAESVESLSIWAERKPVETIYLRTEKPLIVALVIEGSGAASAPLVALSLQDYMPTLIAVRNGSPMYFRDRIRDLSREFFVFQRDRMKLAGRSRLEYSARGFRGTGDYGERLLPGDQIVDLEGRFIGLAVDENTINAIEDISAWQRISLKSPPRESLVPVVRALESVRK